MKVEALAICTQKVLRSQGLPEAFPASSLLSLAFFNPFRAQSLGIDKVANFPFPTPPRAEDLSAAERELVLLGALDASASCRPITPLGRVMAALPVSPRPARSLLAVSAASPRGRTSGSLLLHGISLAAAASLESPFVHDDGDGGDGADGGAGQDDGEGTIERRKEWRRGVRHARTALFHPASDVLSAMAALRAYEDAQHTDGLRSAMAMCARAGLHARVLREMSLLRAQLARTLPGALSRVKDAGAELQQLAHAAASAASAGASRSSAVPSAAEETALRRALCVGWVDCIARRVGPADLDSRTSSSEKSRRTSAVRYAAEATDEPVFLHPRSSLRRAAPRWLVFQHILRSSGGSGRAYMQAATALEESWLSSSAAPVVALSEPLTDPPAWYDSASDRVLCWREATLGPKAWPLPRVAAPHPDPTERAAAFGAALLSGAVLPSLAQLSPFLAAQPAMMQRPEARGHRRVGELLAALHKRGASSRAGLMKALAQDPAFAQAELALWLRAGEQPRLRALWPGLLRELLAS